MMSAKMSTKLCLQGILKSTLTQKFQSFNKAIQWLKMLSDTFKKTFKFRGVYCDENILILLQEQFLGAMKYKWIVIVSCVQWHCE